MVDLRHNSCADVSLIASHFYHALKDAPPLRKGPKMDLVQVSKGSDSFIEGYVTLPIFQKSLYGELVETEVEVFVLVGMSCPILLGEDYHQTYEIATVRDVQKGLYIGFKQEPRAIVRAALVKNSKDYSLVEVSKVNVSKLSKAKAHQRRKHCRQHARISDNPDKHCIRLANDIEISPHSTVVVPVSGSFEGRDSWFIERYFKSDGVKAPFVVPNTFFLSKNP